jgi:hypothetical protein
VFFDQLMAWWTIPNTCQLPIEVPNAKPVARALAPAGLRSSPKNQQPKYFRLSRITTAAPERGPAGGSKLSRHNGSPAPANSKPAKRTAEHRCTSARARWPPSRASSAPTKGARTRYKQAGCQAASAFAFAFDLPAPSEGRVEVFIRGVARSAVSEADSAALRRPMMDAGAREHRALARCRTLGARPFGYFWGVCQKCLAVRAKP